MSGSVNKVIIVGNLGKDPEIRRTQDGRAIANLNIATSETWRDKQTGERREKTEWHRVVCFNENLTKVMEQYLHKGDKVYIEGKLQTRKWTDQQGVERYVTEVMMQAFDGKLVMLATKGGGGASGSSPDNDGGGADDFGTSSSKSPTGSTPKSAPQRANDLDDEIPF